jgi:hypothetical protein
MTVAGFPLRQWLIGLSGLACGMAVAVLVHYAFNPRGCKPRERLLKTAPFRAAAFLAAGPVCLKENGEANR